MNPVRVCHVCRQTDDHPRHVIDIPGLNETRHLDCCRSAGCPDGSCDALAAAGGTHLRGDELRAFLITDPLNKEN